MKKLAYILHGLPCGGVETWVKDIAPKVTDDYEVTILLVQDFYEPNESAEFFKSKNIKIIYLGGNYTVKRMFKYLNCLYKCYKENNFDIVHSHMSTFNGINLMVAAVCGIKKRVSHAHGSSGATCSNNKVTSFKKLILTLGHPIASFITKIFSTDLVGVSKLACEFAYGKKSKKATVIVNPINMEKYKCELDEIEDFKKNFFTNDYKNIAVIGRLSADKNLLFKLDVVEELSNIRQDFRWHFVGAGTLRQQLEDQTKIKKIDDICSFYGWRNDINYFLNSVDAYVSTSRSEGLAYTIIEAEFCNVDCFIFDSLPKELNIGKTIVMNSDASPKDWAIKISEYFNSNKNLILNTEKAKKFEMDTIINKLQEIYNN